jgi:hypothetical protein
MSYLAQYVARPGSVRRARSGARVDEQLVLNLPFYDGGAYVRVFVEDTSTRKRRWRHTPPSPRLRLRIADCVNEVNLEFAVDSEELRANGLHKITTLIDALERFRDGFLAEGELYALRERNPRSRTRR